MEKKTYITPSMKVRRIDCTHILCCSGGEKSLYTINNGVEEEYSQW